MSELERRLGELLGALESDVADGRHLLRLFNRTQEAFELEAPALTPAEIDRSLALHACLRETVARRLVECSDARVRTAGLRGVLAQLGNVRATHEALDLSA